MRTLTLFPVLVILASCASAPPPSAGPYVAPATYGGLDCDALRREAVRLSARVREILAAEKKGRKSAPVRDKGLTSPWLATFYMTPGAGMEELRGLDPSYRAIAQAATDAECTVAGEMLNVY